MDEGPRRQRWLRVVLAWAVVLGVSDLPDVLGQLATGAVPPWLGWAKVALAAAALGACFLQRALRPLVPFALVVLVFELALRLSEVARASAGWRAAFGGESVSFTRGYVGIYVLDLGVALAVLAALWAVKRRRADFFLTTGDLAAPVEPVRWLGIGRGESWRALGWIFALVAALAVAVPVFLSLRVAPGALGRAVPLLPAAFLFAAVNAFTEEVYFRASLLATLPDVVGRGQALLLNVALFGLAHWLYGTPAGLVGFLMTGFLAFLLGKAMLETRGLFWPWLIHFLPDAVVFAAYAIDFSGR